MDYQPGAFAALEEEHAQHRLAGLGVIDPNCLWCNGTLSRFWRAVDLEDE